MRYARYRGRERVQEQCLLTATAQNIAALVAGGLLGAVMAAALGPVLVTVAPDWITLIACMTLAMLVVVLVASEADRVGVRQRLPDEVVIGGTPLDGAELTVMVRAFLRNWRRDDERTGEGR